MNIRTTEDLNRIESYLLVLRKLTNEGQSIGEAIDITHETKAIEERAMAYMVGADHRLERRGEARTPKAIINEALAKVDADRIEVQA